MQPLYILNSDLASLRGKYVPYALCSAAEAIVNDQISGSFLNNNVWSIYTKNHAARNDLLKHGTLSIENQKIELFDEHPAVSHSVSTEKIVFRNVPPHICDEEVLDFLHTQPGVIIKSKVVSGRIRNQKHELSQYYSGEKIVYVKGNFTPALPNFTDFGDFRVRVWHATQNDACQRCRHLGHNHLETDNCDAFLQSDDVIAFKSPNYVLCNFYADKLFVYERHFTSVEQAYQWKKMQHIGHEAYSREIMLAKTPGRAKQIANRVPYQHLKTWHSIKRDVMREILAAKCEQCPKFKETLLKSEGKRLVEATQDLYWASGLPPILSSSTKPECFPGCNWLGRILEDMRHDITQSNQRDDQSTSDMDIIDHSTGTTSNPQSNPNPDPAVATTSDTSVATTPNSGNVTMTPKPLAMASTSSADSAATTPVTSTSSISCAGSSATNTSAESPTNPPLKVTPSSSTDIIKSSSVMTTPINDSSKLVTPLPPVHHDDGECVVTVSPTHTEVQLKVIERDIELFPKLLVEADETQHRERRKARSLLRDSARARSMSARPKGHDMQPIDSYFIRKRKASGIASSPTSPDHGPADKVVRCTNVDNLKSPPLSPTDSEPALLIMDDEAAATAADTAAT